LALLLALPSKSFAQGKIRVAVWEFENHAATQWYSNQLGPAARNQIDTEFSENQLLSSKFSVVERDKLNLVLKEQGLATTGAVDPATAASCCAEISSSREVRGRRCLMHPCGARLVFAR